MASHAWVSHARDGVLPDNQRVLWLLRSPRHDIKQLSMPCCRWNATQGK
jgi:hypothetical protein